MTIKNILLTGDDGYNSIGTRILVHFLKNKYSLTVAATKKQQSSVGGKLTLNQKIKWGKAQVDGVEAIWVDGTPADVMNFSKQYFQKKFDLIISGINFGSNISNAIFSSGTYAAAFRALSLGLAPQALVMSLNRPPAEWYKDGDLNENLEPYLQYPGKAMDRVIDLIIQNHFWGCKLLNINFPRKKSKKLKFTKPNPRICRTYICNFVINEKEHYYLYPGGICPKQSDSCFDNGAMQKGFISITPCQDSILKADVYSKLKDLTFEL